MQLVLSATGDEHTTINIDVNRAANPQLIGPFSLNIRLTASSATYFLTPEQLDRIIYEAEAARQEYANLIPDLPDTTDPDNDFPDIPPYTDDDEPTA